MIRSKTTGSKIADILIWIITIIITLTCLAPLINTVAISFSNQSIAAANMVYLLPVKFTLSSYNTLLSDGQFWTSFLISVERVFLGTSVNMLLTILMAYPLSKNKKQFRFRNIYMILVIFSMLFSGGLVPLYITVKSAHLLNSIWSLILPGAVPAFNVILLMNFFRGVPKSLEEAAVIDGANQWNILFRIFLPVSLPALATIVLFCVVNHWNDFFNGLIYINTPTKYPLQTYIQQFTVKFSAMNVTNPEEIRRYAQISNRTLNSAKIVVSTLPLIAIYPFLQKYFVTGIVMGSVKE